ncbi:hypothetical protein OROMI_030711 [Orobanche minor]
MMSLYKWLILVVLVGLYDGKPHLDESRMTIVVDPSGKRGSYRSIQAAVDSIPHNNRKWMTIAIKKERVVIPYDKPFIFLKGEGKDETILVWDAHGKSDQTPTFTSRADNVLGKDMTFMNSYNSPPATNRNLIEVGVAARIQGDKSAFYGYNYARVLFFKTAMADIVVPQGWDHWSSVGHEDLLSLGEYNCSGPGARSSGRVKWEKKFSETEVAELASVSFIDDKEGWLNKALQIMGP